MWWVATVAMQEMKHQCKSEMIAVDSLENSEKDSLNCMLLLQTETEKVT